MDIVPNKPKSPATFTTEVNKQYLNLHPYAELAKYIMDSPTCEIHITDSYYHGSVAGNGDDILCNDRLYNDTINQNGTYEIKDLSKNTRYKDHSYVTESPHFRYYCGAKLTTTSGKDIGSICVLDTKSKGVSSEQKSQLQQLANLVVNTIEQKNRFRDINSKLESLSDCFHKLNHDVRIPISGIAGLADLLIVEKDHIEFPAKELAMIQESAESIINVIDEVLEDAKTGNNGHEKGKDSRIGIIVDQLKHLYNPPAKAKELSLTFNTQVDPNLTVSHSFALKLLQIIGNLLSNAVKFTPENGALEVTINKKSDKNEPILNISVKDTGKSMSSDQIAAINNGSNTVTRSIGTNGEQSFGKGLTYVKQLVAKTEGTISVKAGQNNGTQFSISLPLPVDNANTNKPVSSLLKDIPKQTSNGVRQGSV